MTSSFELKMDGFSVLAAYIDETGTRLGSLRGIQYGRRLLVQKLSIVWARNRLLKPFGA